jgi:aquaporin Z
MRHRKLVAECFGTFALVFAGTGAIVVDATSGGQVTHVGVSLTFGLVVLAMIYAVGDVSGAHLNPAVTLGFVIAGRFPRRQAIPYVVAQTAGAFLASGLLRVCFPSESALGATVPTGSVFQSFIFEVVLTLVLMVVILSVATGGKERGLLAGVAIGSVIAFEALFAGPVSGASMNPVRSLAPAVFSGNLTHLWIYLVASPLGAALAVIICKSIHETGCCSGLANEEKTP